MYRIRVLNSDGTFGGFFSDKGIVDDVTLANTYSSSLSYQKDIERAFFMSGGLFQPSISYGINDQPSADEEKANADKSVIVINSFVGKDINTGFGVKRQVLPPFEDKPSATELGNGVFLSHTSIDIDGGYTNQTQQIDIDGGGA